VTDRRLRPQVVLIAPQIAPNTGNIIRLCANAGADLHLVEPLGFSLDDRLLRRAGLDYHDLITVTRHASWADARSSLASAEASMWAFSGRGTRSSHDAAYGLGDTFVFGAEENGIPDDILASFDGDHTLRIPMQPSSRSINLANAVAIVVYEAWRQHRFAGGGDRRHG
jgi:tRNA (cytidine/uridine-2'-O-)-methyltransferase